MHSDKETFTFTSHYSDYRTCGLAKEGSVLAVLSLVVITAVAVLVASLVSVYRDVLILRDLKCHQNKETPHLGSPDPRG